MKKIICFGEVLWDVFPTYKRIGGAPLNVAVRLASFQNDVSLISKIGQDEEGIKIIDYLSKKGVNVACLQKDNELKTGSVSVLLNGEGSASYTIDSPRAWDAIGFDEKAKKEVEAADAFIFGSLVCRNTVSKNTLFEFLNSATYKVFDVNLRAPFYNREVLVELMGKADFIKFNDDELLLIAEYFGSQHRTLEKHINFLSKATNTPHICVTRGKDGAILLYNGKLYHQKGYPVEVVNTVGAGDSFLASLISYLLKGESPQYAMDLACAVGGLVAQSEGANPELTFEEIHSFRNL